MALILAVIFVAVLTIGTAATIEMVNSNEKAFGRDRQVNRALNVAEAGLNAGVNTVRALPATAISAPGASGTTDHGSWSYTVTRTQDTTNPDVYIWTVTSTGVSPDGKVSRIISTKVQETITHHSTTTSTTTPQSDAYLYNFFLGDPASDCTTGTGTGNVFSGNGVVNVDVYARGSLCVGGSSGTGILQPTGTSNTLHVYVGKKFKFSGQASVGTSSAKINTATIVGGCLKASGQSVTCSSSSNSHVYANTYSSTQNDVPKPTIDTNKYTTAKPGPTTGCNDDPTHPGNAAYMSSYPTGWTASYFKSHVLDNNSTRDTSVGSVNLLRLVDYSSASNFDCRYYDSSGNLQGRLAWTYGSPGTLIISGTVFIDGNLVFDGTNYAVYQGRGNIYINGTVNWAGQAKVCASPTSGNPCLGNFNPASNLLEIVAINAGNGTNGFSVTGQETFEGVCFTNGAFQGAGNSVFHGAVIADTATEQGNGGFTYQINPPPGAPGAAETTTSSTSDPDTAAFVPVPGSWQQLK